MRKDVTSINYGDYIRKFSELENGMSVMLRNGEEYIYIDHHFYDKDFILTDLGYFKDNFSHCDDYMSDIIVVYNPFGNGIWEE